MSSLDSFKAKRDFQYEKEAVETPSLWDRFWQWFWGKYDEIMQTEAGRTTMKIIYWVLGIAAIAFFIFRVMRMNRIALFAGSSLSHTPYSAEEENIHSISFETAIQDAMQQGNYRLAIRLLYLQNLKLLSDRNLIVWRPDKTNADYTRELEQTSLQQSFSSITRTFEYAWYGNHTVPESDFDDLQLEFNHFQKQL